MMKAVQQAIRPAKVLSRRSHLIPGQLRVTELTFEVPKNHYHPDGTNISLFARLVAKHERPIAAPSGPAPPPKPLMAYLQGGPGFGNPAADDMALTRAVLDRGYDMLYLDYRGTGLSTPINADGLPGTAISSSYPGSYAAHGDKKKTDPRVQADYLTFFRQTHIARDSEAVRMALTADYPDELKPWSVFGQSFGGFVAMTYLSFHAEGLREVFLTGGLAPVGHSADDVYQATFRKVLQRNEAYYAKFPEDVRNVRRIASHLAGQEQGGVPLPAGGLLTAPRLLTAGLAFGAHGGFDSVHGLVVKLVADLDQFGFLTWSSLRQVEGINPFDANPIYAILHEAIYVDGPGAVSNWAALRAGMDVKEFSWLEDTLEPGTAATAAAAGGAAGGGAKGVFADDASAAPLYFSGEMIYPFHFSTHPELMRMREAAHILAEKRDWEPLYDLAQLARNEVPVYAASFVEDMYVDADLARETARKVRNTRVFETNVLYHSALRYKSDEVISQLFKLRDDVLD